MEPKGSDSTPPWKAEQERSKTEAVPPPPPQWMPARYPAAAMQHRVIPPQHYVPRPPQFYLPHQHFKRHQEGSSGEKRTLWVGDLYPWMDEAYLYTCFAPAGEVLAVKVIRNKQTNSSEGYGFVEFYNHAMAEKVLENYSGTLMPNTDQPLLLNWATFGTGEKRSDNVLGYSIFVGDLAADVTDSLLRETFADKYPSIKAAKVVFDANTGRSKGYGFVRFGDDSERTKAMAEMNGAYCSTRPMRIGAATPRKSSGYQNQYSPQANGSPAHGQSDVNSTNTTVFVGGLDSKVTDEDLKQPFSQYGEIVSVKIPLGKGCGFVQFASRNNAEEALEKLNGTVIGSHTVRLSWGRNPANKQYHRDFGNRWTGAYYGGHPYGYGYGALPPPYHDPRMYGAGFGAYPMYGSHHQQQVS